MSSPQLPPYPPPTLPFPDRPPIILRLSRVQVVLDHPTLSTSDELAEFLTWPDDARDPVFARARTSLQAPPPNAQRRAMARAFSLRQAAQRRSSGSADSPPLPAVEAAAAAAAAQPEAAQPEAAAAGSGARPSVASARASATATTPRTSSVKSAASSPGYTPSWSRHQEAGYTDALAAAMLHTANDAAAVMQHRAREHSKLRNSRLTEDHEDDGNTARLAAATERFAARMEAAGGGSGGGCPSLADPSLLSVLNKLEQMDARLQLMERNQRGWLGSLFGILSCNTLKSGGEEW